MDSKRNQAVKTAWVGFPPRSEETRLLTFPCFSGELKLKKHHGRAETLLMAQYLKRTIIKDQVA